MNINEAMGLGRRPRFYARDYLAAKTTAEKDFVVKDCPEEWKNGVNRLVAYIRGLSHVGTHVRTGKQRSR